MSADKLQAVREGHNAQANLLEHHQRSLHELESDIRGQLFALSRAVSTERVLADDRHLTHGTKLDVLNEQMEEVRRMLAKLVEQLGMNGSGGSHG